MAIIERSFEDRIHAIAVIPENEITNYNIYGDLSFAKKTYINSFYNTYVSSQFSQIKELFKVLELIKKEIMRNDYAILRNDQLQKDLPKVFKHIFKLFESTATPDLFILDRVATVRDRCFAYYPLGNQDGRPVVSKLAKEKKDLTFQVLMEDLEQERFPTQSPSKVHFFTRILTYADELFNVPPDFKLHLNEIVFQLFEKPSLNQEEIDFLNFALRSRAAYDPYGISDFLGYLNIKFNEFLKINARNNPFEKLANIYEIVVVYKNLERFFMDDPYFIQRSIILQFITQSLIGILEHLPQLNKTCRDKLKEVFILVPMHNRTNSIFNIIISRLYLENTLKLQHSSLCHAGFITTKGDHSYVPEEWMSVLDTLEVDVNKVLEALYRNYSRFPSKSPEFTQCQKVQHCISILHNLKYYAAEALKDNGSDIFLEKMTRLNSKEVEEIAALFLTSNFSLHRVIQLLNAAEKASNEALAGICYSFLIKNIFKKIDLKMPINLSSEQFIKLIERTNVSTPSKCQFDISKFPTITLQILKQLLRKIPDLDLINFPCSAKSKLSDIIISDGENNFFHFNRDILARSSNYFRAIFETGLQENSEISRGNMKQKLIVELDEENFSIFYKWSAVLLQPSLAVERKTVEESDPSQYVLELNFANYFGMDKVLEKMKAIYTKIVKEQSLESVETWIKAGTKEVPLIWYPDPSKRVESKEKLEI